MNIQGATKDYYEDIQTKNKDHDNREETRAYNTYRRRGKYRISSKIQILGSIISEDGKLEEEMQERITAGGRLFNSTKNTFLWKKTHPKKLKREF